MGGFASEPGPYYGPHAIAQKVYCTCTARSALHGYRGTTGTDWNILTVLPSYASIHARTVIDLIIDRSTDKEMLPNERPVDQVPRRTCTYPGVSCRVQDVVQLMKKATYIKREEEMPSHCL